MQLSQFFNDVYRPLRLLGKSKRTVVLYGYSIRCFETTLGRTALLSDLSDMNLANHLQRLVDDGYAKHSVRKEQMQLNAIWRFAFAKKMVDEMPTLALFQVPETVPKAWTQEELGKLIVACKSTPGKIAGMVAADWWTALHYVLWDTGERIGAVRAVTWDDIQGDWITFRAETRKGGRKANQCRLHPETMRALEYLRQESGKVFPWDRSETYLYHRYSKILKRAGALNSRHE